MRAKAQPRRRAPRRPTGQGSHRAAPRATLALTLLIRLRPARLTLGEAALSDKYLAASLSWQRPGRLLQHSIINTNDKAVLVI